MLFKAHECAKVVVNSGALQHTTDKTAIAVAIFLLSSSFFTRARTGIMLLIVNHLQGFVPPVARCRVATGAHGTAKRERSAGGDR